jgi:Response regulator containing a CheY-like receiver domain and an HTH DNA-binding domain
MDLIPIIVNQPRMKRKTIQIAILDDHQSMIQELTTLLQDQTHIQVAVTAGTLRDLLYKMTGNHIDVLLADDVLLLENEDELTRRFKEIFPQMKIAALEASGQHDAISRMIKERKIAGTISKTINRSELAASIGKIASNTFFREKALQKMPRVRVPKKGSKSLQLTERELEVLRLIEQEYSNKEIARALLISERTVETHRKNIFRKTKTNSIIGLIKYAYEHKLV